MSKEFNIDEVVQFIRDSSPSTSIYIGADSERYRGRDEQWYADRKSTRLNSSHVSESRMPSSA